MSLVSSNSPLNVSLERKKCDLGKLEMEHSRQESGPNKMSADEDVCLERAEQSSTSPSISPSSARHSVGTLAGQDDTVPAHLENTG